jgi:diguanylate cyclase (GGDEF)-like protein/PAS domain S-box-containing protein
VLHDVSERRQAEARLRQAAKVFESTTEGVVITDLGGKVLAVNHAFGEITGYGAEEALGQNPRMLKSGRHDSAFYQAMWASILKTGSWQGEIWNRRKNGETYPEWLTINTVLDEQRQAVNYVGVFTDISQLKRSEAQLEHMAHHDPLTDLPNRLLLIARLDHAMQRAQRDGTAVAVLFVDLDRFKTVNDSLGHPVGDRLLQEVARVLAHCVRAEDTVARLGGDEFVVMLEGLSDTDFASGVAQKILAALAKPIELDGQTLYIGASIGISLYPSDGDDPATLLKNADAAMYRSKDDGRNVFRYYSAELTRSARERLSLEAGLRQAIKEQQFILYYQPQIDVASGALVGAEALIRWQHPQSGLISPLRFIPLAEETGLILPLGEWVLTTACEQLKAWLDAGMPTLTLAVNLSPRQFRQPDLAHRIRAILDAAELDPAHLELEITEGAIMEQGEGAVATLHALKDLGVRLAIDDFGTGYSSLAYLRRFPIDILKIDQSFMRDIPRDVHAMEIAATIVSMARNLHLHVLAEGVENEEQLAFLQLHGCDAFQGYLFSPPVPAVEFQRFLERGQR